MDELQVENGNFTRIVNPLIEELIKIPFKGCELAVALFIIRKTYGFQKKEDEISLTQFQEGLQRARSTINLALKTLQLVGVVKLVKRGNIKGASNIWIINKYHTQWNLVRLNKLVRQKRKPSMTERQNLVGAVIHTKETNKRNTKEKEQSSHEIGEIIEMFKTVNPSYKKLFGSPPQRRASLRLYELHGIDKLRKMVNLLPRSNAMDYMPVITTPCQLEDKMGQLAAGWQKIKNKEPIIL